MKLPDEIVLLGITENDLLSVGLESASAEQEDLVDRARELHPELTERLLLEIVDEYEQSIPELDEALAHVASSRSEWEEISKRIFTYHKSRMSSRGVDIIGRMKDFVLKHFTLQASLQPAFAAGGESLVLTEPEPGATEGRAGCGLILPEGFEGWTIEAILGEVYLALELRLPEATDKAFDIWVTTGVESLQMTGVTPDPDEPNLIILDHVKYDKERKRTSIPTVGSFEINTIEDLEARFAELNLLALILVVPAES